MNVDVIESDSVNGMLCVEISGIPNGGLECDIEITFEPQISGSTAGQYNWQWCIANVTV